MAFFKNDNLMIRGERLLEIASDHTLGMIIDSRNSKMTSIIALKLTSIEL